MQPGPEPTANVPKMAPLVESFVTLLELAFATQVLAPSKQIPWGLVPTEKLVAVFGPHLSRATCNGLIGKPLTPCGPVAPAGPLGPCGPACPAEP